MKSSIQWKIIGIYLCVVLVIMIASGSFIIVNIENTQVDKLKEEMREVASKIELALEIEQGIVSEDLLRTMAITRHSVAILDQDGNVIKATSKDLGDHIGSPVVLEAIEERKEAISEEIHFGSTQRDNTMEHARPVLDAETNQIRSIIYVEADTTEVYENIVDVMKTISLGSVLAMVIATLFSAVFSRMITVPIKQLTNSSKQLAAGRFSRIPIYSFDEIGQLTQSFNYMATELSRTMGAISSEKSKLEKILENMADGVMAFNRQGVLIHANSVCYEMLGNTNMDHRFDFIFPKLGVEVSFDRILAEEVKYEDGVMMSLEERFFKLHFAPYTNVLGEGEGLVVVMQDITTQHKLDQMRKDFVANVSHELRTPLTTLKSYTETLLDGALEDEETARSFLNVMEKETDRMTRLVQDLLELSRIDNKQMQLEMKPIYLGQIMEETIQAQMLQAEKKGHHIHIQMDSDKKYCILGDGARIRQVLHNILSNAIKYSIDPGEIYIRVFENDQIVIQIQDTGIGMSKGDLERIFERFYRVDKARSRNMGGTGLGLSIAKEMVELHGGKIKVSSKLGKGTTVTLYFNRYR